MHRSHTHKLKINLNPTTPTIRGLIKIHKKEAPIRPIINWKNAPAYRISKLLVKKLQSYIPLPYTFNVPNTTSLIQDLTNIPYNHRLRLASFDMVNMYTNIPTIEVLDIINKLCHSHGV